MSKTRIIWGCSREERKMLNGTKQTIWAELRR